MPYTVNPASHIVTNSCFVCAAPLLRMGISLATIVPMARGGRITLHPQYYAMGVVRLPAGFLTFPPPASTSTDGAQPCFTTVGKMAFRHVNSLLTVC